MTGGCLVSNGISKSIYDQALDHIKKYLDLRDKVLDNEFVQLAGDVSKVVSFVRGANQLIVNKRFNSFLKGFSDNEVPTQEQIEKLIKYIDDESKAEFISDTFTKILLANSSKACLLMGTLLKSIVDQGGDLDHDKLVCISALTNFFDIDLKNFKTIFDFIDEKSAKSNPVGASRKKLKTFTLDGLGKFSKDKGLNYSSILLTVEKSVTSQLVSRSYQANISVEYDKDMDMTDVDNTDIDEYYHMNQSAILLREYLGRIPL
jgi:hypothetical protein